MLDGRPTCSNFCGMGMGGTPEVWICLVEQE